MSLNILLIVALKSSCIIPTSSLSQYLFLFSFFFWLHWVFVAAHGLDLVVASEGYSSLRCAGFALQWLLLLWSADSVIVA